MKKTIGVVVIHLIIQLLIAAPIIIWSFHYYKGPLGGIGVIYIYISTAFALILTSFILTILIGKIYRSELFYSTFFSCLLYVIVPMLYLSTKNDPGNDEELKKDQMLAIQQSTMHACKEMGFSTCNWSKKINHCIIETEDNKKHTFILTNGFLYTYAYKALPLMEDTLAWLRLTLQEASPFLNAYAYKNLDSSIHAKNYWFEINRGPSFGINIEIPFDTLTQDIWLRGNANAVENTNDSYGNFSISMKYGSQTRKAEN